MAEAVDDRRNFTEVQREFRHDRKADRNEREEDEDEDEEDEDHDERHRFDDLVVEGEEKDPNFEGFQLGPVPSGQTKKPMTRVDVHFLHQLEREEEEEVKLPMWAFGTIVAAFCGLSVVVLLLIRRKVEHNTYSAPVTVDNL